MATKISQIAEDYSVGDAIRISCTLGVKEGFILQFYDDRIKLRPIEQGKKPMSISEDTIKDWEEADVVVVPADDNVVVPIVEPSEKPVDVVPDVVEKEFSANEGAECKRIEDVAVVEQDVSDNADKDAIAPAEENSAQKPLPDHVKGFLDLSKVDPHGGRRASIHSARELALSKQPESTLEQREPRLVGMYKKDEDNHTMVKAVGYITKDNKDYGFIWDQELESEIIFYENDILDDDLYNHDDWKGVQVVYSKVKGPKGAKAVGVCLPRPIYELLAMAESWSDDVATAQDAYDVLMNIKAQYPSHEETDLLIKTIGRNANERKLHSRVVALDVETLKKQSIPAKKSENEMTKSEKANIEYKNARDCVNRRQHKEALEYFLKAFKAQHSINLIKDICNQYCTLCSKKYLDEHPEEKEKVEETRRLGREFLKNNEHRLPKELSTYHFLESVYFVFHEYEKFIDIVDKIIKVKAPSQKIIYLNKKAVALLAMGEKEKAKDVLEQILKIDSENLTAKKYLQQLKDNEVVDWEKMIEQSEISDNPISSFLVEIIENYTDFYGVPNYKIMDKTKLFSKEVYNDIVTQANQEGVTADSQKRSQLLLTKIKIGMELNGTYDKRDFALYCNDMARLSIIRNPNSVVWDVVRFYFNESFALTSDWLSTRRQFVQYLETLVPSKRDGIFDKLHTSELEKRMREDISFYVTSSSETASDMDWLDGLLHPSIYNEEISNKVASVLFEKEELRKVFVQKMKPLGKSGEAANTRDGFMAVWKELRDERFASETNLKNSFLSRIKRDSLQQLNASMESLNAESKQSWLFTKDRERLNDVFRVLVPKIESYLKSQEYTSREDFYRDATRLLAFLVMDIRQNPTKFSYEALLPLLVRFQELITEDWEKYEKGSKPVVLISLLTQEACINDEGLIELQLAVATEKQSSPINNISLIVDESEEIAEWGCKEDKYVETLKGGDKAIIFHLNLKLKSSYISIKAFSLTVTCLFNTTNDEKASMSNELAIKLYSVAEFRRFPNPYNAGDAVTRRDMFFGRQAFIDNLVDVIYSSPSKQLVFYGQKRSGKSSVLYWLQDELEKRGSFCARFSVGSILENLTSTTLFHTILLTIKGALKRIKGDKPSFDVPPYEDFENENRANPVQTFSKYMAEFKEACKEVPGWENKPIVVMIDEFTYIYSKIRSGQVDETIMQQWKSVIQEPDSSFAAVLVGQDVIPYFKQEVYARNAFQMMEDYRLNYLEESYARDLIEVPIGKERYAQGTVDLILEYSACNPYYIQMICSELVNDMNKKKSMIATTADVNNVVNTMILRFDSSSFDNLISPGDAIQIEEVTERNIKTVLYRIAQQTVDREYCSMDDIVKFFNEELLPDEKNIIEKVLENLYARDVIAMKEGLYRIKVKLFKQWMLTQTPQWASLKEPER